VAILVVTGWVVSDPLNLAVSIYMAIMLVLGFIVVGRSDRPVAIVRRSGYSDDDQSVR
jgi:hypothetical protein